MIEKIIGLVGNLQRSRVELYIELVDIDVGFPQHLPGAITSLPNPTVTCFSTCRKNRPVNACMTAAAYDKFHVLENN